MPSKFTIELQNGQRKSLPFDDRRDCEEQKRGFIAAPSYNQIMAGADNVAWDMGSYEWLLQGKAFDSIHPSFQRQAKLNMALRFVRLTELTELADEDRTVAADNRPPAERQRHNLQH